MAATREQERNALQKIRKIVEGLGEDSYIGMAFEGVWELAKENIENDHGNSCKWYIDNYYKSTYDYTKLAEVHDKQVTELEAELSLKGSVISEQEIHFQELEKSYEAVYHEKFEMGMEISSLKAELGFARKEIVELKAKLYDLMFKGD